MGGSAGQQQARWSATQPYTWAVARTLGLVPEQVASPLAARPYDLRHAAVCASG